MTAPANRQDVEHTPLPACPHGNYPSGPEEISGPGPEIGWMWLINARCCEVCAPSAFAARAAWSAICGVNAYPTLLRERDELASVLRKVSDRLESHDPIYPSESLLREEILKALGMEGES